MKRRLMEAWKRIRLQSKEQRGFTLIELAVALAIMGILIAIAVPTYMGVRNRSYDSEAKEMIGEIRQLAWSYFLETNGFPDDLGDLKYDGTSQNWTFTVDGDTDSVDIRADGIDGKPSAGRCWILTLNDDGNADPLKGPNCED